MRRCLTALLLTSTVLGGCAADRRDVGPTVIDGPPPPALVEVPVYVQDPASTPPPMPRLPPPGSPTKHLQTLNRRTLQLPDPNRYVGGTYVLPAIPNHPFQVYMEQGKQTFFQLPAGSAQGRVSVAVSKPHEWEAEEDFGEVETPGGTARVMYVRPYVAGMRKEDLTIVAGGKLYLFKVTTYPERSDIYHRTIVLETPSPGAPAGDAPAPPGLTAMGGPPGIPPESARDYAYSVGRGTVAWRPSAVFSSGGKTFIELPRDGGDVGRPQVVDTSTGADRPLNWYVQEGRYIVIPDTVLRRAEMRRGGETVTIRRDME